MRIKLVTMLVLFLLFCLSGCAHKSNVVDSKSSTNNIKIAHLAIKGTYTESGFTVNEVAPKGPAEIAGIKKGDILLKIDNSRISSRKEMRDLLNKSIKSKQEVEISLLRGGSHMTIRVTPKIIEVPPSIVKLIDLVEDTKVVVAVIVGDVNNNLPTHNKVNIDDWKKSIRLNVIANYERMLLSVFSNNENFKLVDRSIINKIVEEYKLNESGLISGEMRINLGKMYGVTHIVQIDCSRFRYGRRGIEDVFQRKLINLQTGTIEASDYYRTVPQ